MPVTQRSRSKHLHGKAGPVCHDALVARRVGMPAVVVTLVLVTGLMLIGWLLWPHADDKDYRVALGTVIQPADCAQHDARASLRVELLDGHELAARLDGCGNLRGEVLAVEVPDPLPPGD